MSTTKNDTNITPSVHVSVLLHEVIEGLTGATSVAALSKNSATTPWFLDGTLGGAGHSMAIAKALGGKVNLIGLDRDPQAIARGLENLTDKVSGKLILENEDFRNMDRVLTKHGVTGLDMILMDLGISSDELETSGRGFSFMKDEPLLMTFGDPTTYAYTAKTIVNTWKEEDIANVIFGYGEEHFAYRIAKQICLYREKKQIETTLELVEIIKGAVPGFYKHKKINPATKTFQALRIAVNDEWKATEEGLAKGYAALREGGRMGIISFHSIEDRIVKNFMRAKEKEGGKLIPRRPVKPSAQEIAENPRSRSAKLRVIEKHTE